MATRERWRPVVGFEGCYEVSDLGRVRSLARTYWHSGGRAPRWCKLRARILKPRFNYKESLGGPYVAVALSVEGVVTYHEVHALVLKAFVGPRPPGQQARHLSGISCDNRLVNLEWGTPGENTADKVRHGTVSRGTARWSAKLNPSVVLVIRAAHKSGASYKALAHRYDVSWTAIQSVVHRRTWKYV